jgi:hypothetical protein
MMNHQYIINFTYKNPSLDFFSQTGTYPNGEIINEYTLRQMKNKLQENIDLIDKLIMHSSKIESIYSIDDELAVNLNCDASFLLDEKVLRPVVEQKSIEMIDQEESNYERKKKVLNLINDTELVIFRNDEAYYDSNDEEEVVIHDPVNEKVICNRYLKLIKDIESDDDSSNGDDSNSSNGDDSNNSNGDDDYYD